MLVYMQEDRLVFKGGPFAVGYCYYHEMKRRGENTLSFLPPNKIQSESEHNKDADTSKQHSFMFSVYQYLRVYLWYVFKFFKAKPRHNIFDNFDIIHFHSTQELFLERENLKHFKGKVILQSHSPMPLGDELYDLTEFKPKWLIPFFKCNLRRMDRYAFLRADYIIFPCEEAEEPYLNRWKEYKKIRDQKKRSYRYVLTGIPQVEPKRQRQAVLDELHLNEDCFLISYAGRHNEAKGYDILKQIGAEFLKENNEAVIVVAGKEYPITRLKHDRWIELGWTDDAKSYISASDVFILPNRETYFDLVMIEVLSLGKIIVASRTGGNRFFEKNNCPGVFLYNTKEECISILKRISGMTKEEKDTLGQKNKEFYLKYLTVSAMYDSYISMISSIE